MDSKVCRVRSDSWTGRRSILTVGTCAGCDDPKRVLIDALCIDCADVARAKDGPGCAWCGDVIAHDGDQTFCSTACAEASARVGDDRF